MNALGEIMVARLLLMMLLLFQRQGQAFWLRTYTVAVGCVSVSRLDDCCLLR